jgi:hypothetical protein
MVTKLARRTRRACGAWAGSLAVRSHREADTPPFEINSGSCFRYSEDADNAG